MDAMSLTDNFVHVSAETTDDVSGVSIAYITISSPTGADIIPVTAYDTNE